MNCDGKPDVITKFHRKMKKDHLCTPPWYTSLLSSYKDWKASKSKKREKNKKIA